MSETTTTATKATSTTSPVASSNTAAVSSPAASTPSPSPSQAKSTPQKSSKPASAADAGLSLKNSPQSKTNSLNLATPTSSPLTSVQTAKSGSEATPANAAPKTLTHPNDTKPLTANLKRGEQPEGLVFGKYKSLEEAEKGYKNLETKLGELSSRVPEQYDVKAAWTAAEMEWSDDFASNERLTTLQKQAREAGLTQDQFAWFVKQAKEEVRAALMEHSPLVDIQRERARLAEQYGSTEQAEAVVRDVMNQVSKLGWPQELLNKPLTATAAGITLLKAILDQRAAPKPITETADAGASRDTRLQALEQRKYAIMNDQNYYRTQAGQKEMDAILMEEMRLKG